MAAHRAVRTTPAPVRAAQAIGLTVAGVITVPAVMFGCQAIATHTGPPAAGVVATPAASRPAPLPHPLPSVYHIRLSATGSGPFSVQYGTTGHLNPPVTLTRSSWSTTMDVRPVELTGITLSVVDLGRSAYADPRITCRISVSGVDQAANAATGPYTITDCLLVGSSTGSA